MTTTHKLILCVALLFNGLSLAGAQEWGLHLSLNESYPINAPGKGQYPMLWYSKAEGRGVLLGGFGGGVSWQRDLKAGWLLKTQANAFRSRHYDEPIIFVDEQGQSLGATLGITTNVNANLLGMVQAAPLGWLQAGLGLGVQGQVWSRSNYGGEGFIFGEQQDLKFRNRSLAPVMLVLPAEATFRLGQRWSVTARAEIGLTPASKVSYFKKERWINTVLEVGYRIKSGKESDKTDTN